MRHIFALIFPLILLCDFTNAQSKKSNKIMNEMNSLINLYQDLEALRREEFSLLVFDKSPNKINSSRSYKFTLRDQLGRDWLFKTGVSSSMDGAISFYRVSTLLGIESPRSHYKQLTIGNQKVYGSLQEVIQNVQEFNGDWDSLNSDGKVYVLNNFVLSWLLANHHVHPGQFLIQKSANLESKIIRIDNSINWVLMGSDKLDIEYKSPMLTHVPFAGYADFWNQYVINGSKFKEMLKQRENIEDKISSGFDLDLVQALKLSKIIELLPNDFYKDFFAICIKNDLKFTSNNEAISTAWMTPANYIKYGEKSNFMNLLLQRKKNIFGDFKKFVEDLKKIRGEKWTLSLSENDLIEKIKEIKNKHNIESEKIKANISLLKKNSISTQSDISWGVPLELYYIMNRLGEAGRYTKKQQYLQLLNEVSESLEKFKMADSKNANIEILNNALENLKLLKSYSEKNDFDKFLYVWVSIHTNKLFESNYIEGRIKNNSLKYFR